MRRQRTREWSPVCRFRNGGHGKTPSVCWTVEGAQHECEVGRSGGKGVDMGASTFSVIKGQGHLLSVSRSHILGYGLQEADPDLGQGITSRWEGAWVPLGKSFPVNRRRLGRIEDAEPPDAIVGGGSAIPQGAWSWVGPPGTC